MLNSSVFLFLKNIGVIGCLKPKRLFLPLVFELFGSLLHWLQGLFFVCVQLIEEHSQLQYISYILILGLLRHERKYLLGFVKYNYF